MFELLNIISLCLAQNEAQKRETFLLLALFAIGACIFIWSCFSSKPFTKEKKVQKPLLVISAMMLFVFFVVYLVYKNN